MNRIIILFCAAVFINCNLLAQRNCISYNYSRNEIAKDPLLPGKISAIENFIQQKAVVNADHYSRTGRSGPIRIPVVIHILYHYPSENINAALVMNQLAELNRDFRHTNPDSVNTPAVFKSVAADCEIEFQLATSDPRQHSTSGIVRKYTPITLWDADDKMKFSSSLGDDAWDAGSYLNIWVCSIGNLAGYSSIPGGSLAKDGIVLDFGSFGNTGAGSGYNQGKTAVHEVGHWLNLKHLWGDTDCGDDLVNDTPRQATYTVGCPSTVRTTCGNGPNGDMYMDYMDFTEDACMNMFTKGQKDRMLSLFEAGGPRNTILSSKGLSKPLFFESPLPEESPRWLYPMIYPVPAHSLLTIDLSYDIRWVGKQVSIINIQGQVLKYFLVSAPVQTIDLSNIQAGMYFLVGQNEDGTMMKMKFIRL